MQPLKRVFGVMLIAFGLAACRTAPRLASTPRPTPAQAVPATTAPPTTTPLPWPTWRLDSGYPAPGATSTQPPSPPAQADLHSPFAGNPPLAPASVRISALSFVDPLQGWALVAASDGVNPLSWRLVYRTGDGGQHWEVLSALEAISYPSDVAPHLPALSGIRFFNPLEGELAGTHRFVTTDGGLTWTNTGPYTARREPVTLEAGRFRLLPGDCAPTEAPKPAACTHSLQVLDGDTWRPQGVVFPAVRADLIPADRRTAWIVAYTHADDGLRVTGHLWRTQDGGRSWQHLLDLPRSAHLRNFEGSYAFAPVDGQTVWLVGGDAGAGAFGGKVVYVSNDGGQTWELRAQVAIDGRYRLGQIQVSGYLLRFTAATAGRAFMALAWVPFITTDDGGYTWKDALPEFLGPGYDAATGPIVFLDAEHGWAVTGEAIYRTVDGGDTWQPGAVPGLPAITPLPPTPSPPPDSAYPGGPTPAPTITPDFSYVPNRVAGAGLIISDSTGVPGWPIAPANYWIQLETGVQVYAGVTAVAEQGAVAVLAPLTDPARPELYLTPRRAGMVQVVGAQGERLVLRSLDGQATFYFDLPTRQFVVSLSATVSAPTVTPLPTHTAPRPTLTATPLPTQSSYP
jgi:hypothetical protein